ncbi:MAG TPA: hypothetical protein PLN21_11520 [Gemmatales bacterium]|nr:hypothetical protein [Gemmatales bacterium]
MWYRSLTITVVCTLAMSQSAWAQPPGRGGRNQDEAIRKLEQEVAQLKGEIKKLQEAQRQSTNRRGGPPAIADRRGGPGSFGGPRGQMAFRGQQFGPQGWNQWQRPQQGFGPNRFQGRGFDPRWNGGPRQFSQRGFAGRPEFGPQQRWQPSRRGEFRTPTRGERGESFRGRQGERSIQPPRSRSGDERRDERPRPDRRPAA